METTHANLMKPFVGQLVKVQDIGPEIKVFGVELLNGGGDCFEDYKTSRY